MKIGQKPPEINEWIRLPTADTKMFEFRTKATIIDKNVPTCSGEFLDRMRLVKVRISFKDEEEQDLPKKGQKG